MANKCLFTNLLVFTSGEGNKATFPSFAIHNALIESSNTSLEALIAGLLPVSGIAKEATFLTAIELLIAIRQLFACADGKRSTSAFCALNGAYNA